MRITGNGEAYRAISTSYPAFHGISLRRAAIWHSTLEHLAEICKTTRIAVSNVFNRIVRTRPSGLGALTISETCDEIGAMLAKGEGATDGRDKRKDGNVAFYISQVQLRVNSDLHTASLLKIVFLKFNAANLRVTMDGFGNLPISCRTSHVARNGSMGCFRLSRAQSFESPVRSMES